MLIHKSHLLLKLQLYKYDNIQRTAVIVLHTKRRLFSPQTRDENTHTDKTIHQDILSGTG